GNERPRRTEIVRPVERWLSGLDPDEVANGHERTGLLPSLKLDVRDWVIQLDAFPIKPEARGEPNHRLGGVGPMSRGWVNDIDRLERSLERKLSHYGELDAPLVVAVLGISPFLERRDVEQALFGRHAVQYQREPPFATRWVRQPNGIWMGPTGPRRGRLSAVL